MIQEDNNWPAIPAADIYPAVTAVLEPGEQVLWQARPAPPPFLFIASAVILLLGLLYWTTDLPWRLVAIWQAYSPGELLPPLLVTIAFIGLIISLNYHRTRGLSYALTDQRVLRLQRDEIAQQATPGQLELRGVHTGIGGAGAVHWRNANASMRERRIQGFYRVPDSRDVHRLLQDWQNTWQQVSDARAEESSEAYRRHRDEESAGATGTASSGGDNTTPAVLHITHPQHNFSLEVPTDWDVSVAEDYDGPWQVFGITLLKRILRRGKPRPYSPGDSAPWNRLNLRGGASTGLYFNVHARGVGPELPEEEQVLHDPQGQALGVPVAFFERDIVVGGFEGFAAVRELPAGSNTIAFGHLPVAVLSRQWWLQGHGLQLEALGIAPADSPTLQETIDRIVKSLRSG